ncbi:MAG: FAD-dependent oxidoreductase [Cereibacter sphaeroides]|uniref:FAD-dependent oxidoreductase n=1 Tax=Cereibacter sphaeroides TaxID=1063 RepID=A0A2W5SEY1_CERSP|nr:MAG: FAD-dependent oxidoreductase [Cereibacter sphaeroides]
MAERIECQVAVIGAGVIGLSVALRLASEGYEVVLLDPNMPGSGASYGNAGTIADYAVMPVGTPAVLKGLPSLLFNPNSPLAIRRSALPSLAPWLLRFARQSLPGPTARNALAIAALTSGAGGDWNELASEIGAEELLQRRGCLYLYRTAAEYRAGEADMADRHDLGIAVEMVRPDALAVMEPGLPQVDGGAAFFPQAIFLNDPGRMMLHLSAAVEAAGVPHIAVAAERLEPEAGSVLIHGQDLRLRARTVVLAAGAHSRALAAQAGDPVPLDTERGYHVEWDMEELPLSRPTCPTSRGFYLCPMAGRLRAVGTVELGGLTAPPSPHRIARLVEGARSVFPDLPEPDREWMGFRPSMPDSLPVIGPSRRGSEVIHAFGHGHIGVTLAPITARIVADLVAGRPPELDISAYRSDRF